MTIEELREGLNSGKKIRIKGYVKPKNNYRMSDEIVDVEIDTQLPSYAILKRQALNEVKRIPLSEVFELSIKHGGTKEDAKKAKEEVVKSLSNNSTSNGRFSDPKYKHLSPYVHYNTETGDIYFTGKQINERKISTSTYKKKNSRPKTLIKSDLQKDLPNQVKNWTVNVKNIDKIELI